MKRTIRSRTLAVVLSVTVAVVSFMQLGVVTSAGNKTLPLASISSSARLTTPSEDKPFVSPKLLSAEIQRIQKYGDMLFEYTKQFDAVTDSAKPDPKKMRSVEAQLKALKSQLPTLLNDLRSCVTKLKDAGKWSDELDNYFEANAPKRKVLPKWVDYVKRNGGARSVFEKNIENLSHLQEAFDKDEKVLAELKTRKVSWLEGSEAYVVQSTFFDISHAAAAGQCFYCLSLIVVFLISGVITPTIFYYECQGACNPETLEGQPIS